MARSTVTRRKPQVPAEDAAAFGPIAERFRRAGDLDRAVSLCREGLQKFPDHISARVTLGWSLLDLGKYNDARTELEAVLRKAPDNLSAIRGLAELHDRSEHTMDLPMDGPGQWPPDASTLEELDLNLTTIAPETAANDDIVDEAVWVPVRGVNEHDEFDSGASQNPAGSALIAPAELGLAMWSAVPAVEPEIGPHVSAASGFGSVREIDPHAGAVSLAAVDEMAKADADIEALIAEAESLEAAADVASIEAVESMEPSLVLDAGLDLGNLDDVALSMPAELTSGLEAPAEFSADTDTPAEQAALAEEPAGALQELTAGPSPAQAIEPGVAVADDDAMLTTEAWQLTAEEPSATGDVDDIDSEVEAPAENVDLSGPEALELPFAASVAEAPAHAAEVFTFARVTEPDPVRSPIPALERLLTRVHARRRLLVAESVA